MFPSFRSCYAPTHDDPEEPDSYTSKKYCYYFKSTDTSRNVFGSCVNRLSYAKRRKFYDQCACNLLDLSDYTEKYQSVCDLLDTMDGECKYFHLDRTYWRSKLNCRKCTKSHSPVWFYSLSESSKQLLIRWRLAGPITPSSQDLCPGLVLIEQEQEQELY